MPSDKVMKFYFSKAWRNMSRYIKTLKHGVCEECGRAGSEVHHIKPINDNNVDDLTISLNPDNLQLLCPDCHNAKRSAGFVREDLSFTEAGDLIIRAKAPPLKNH